MLKQVTDMETWLLDNDGRIFRFVVYKRMFTPYEQEKKFSDESQFEDTHYRFGMIEEAIDLGNGKWLIGLREIIDTDGEIAGYVSYYRLEDIQLQYFEMDQNMLLEDDD